MKEPNLPLRDRQKLETRRHIQNVAKSFIIVHGYENTTMRALAKAAGVGLGTISLHFKDKRSLLLASFHEEIGLVAMNAINSVPQEAPVREQLQHILTRIYGYYATNTGYLRAVVKEALFVRGEWGEIFEAQIAECIALVVGLLEQCKQRGEIKADVDCGKVTMVFWSLYINGLVDGFKQEPFNPDLQTAKVMPLCDIVLLGVTT